MINTVETYTALITSEHKDKPKFMAVVEANTKFYAHLQSVIGSIPSKFDVDTAVGHQLDVVGLWAGVSRFIRSPLVGVYFEWDNADVGWDRGLWLGDFAPTTGVTELPDEYYRLLIKAKIAANQWDGSIPGAYDVWESLFTSNTIIIQDNQNMSMGVVIAGDALDALTKALITGGYIPLKPEGVRVSYFAIPGVTAPIFSWDTEDNVGLAGWDVGAWAEILSPT
jgi:hypothetical protein